MFTLTKSLSTKNSCYVPLKHEITDSNKRIKHGNLTEAVKPLAYNMDPPGQKIVFTGVKQLNAWQK